MLKDTSIANPFRNRRLLDVMQSLENKMGRAVAHKPKMLSEDALEAMLEEVRHAARVGSGDRVGTQASLLCCDEEDQSKSTLRRKVWRRAPVKPSHTLFRRLQLGATLS